MKRIVAALFLVAFASTLVVLKQNKLHSVESTENQKPRDAIKMLQTYSSEITWKGCAFMPNAQTCKRGASISYARTLSSVDSRCNPENEYLKPNTVSSYSYEVATQSGAIRSSGTNVGLNIRCKFDVESSTRCSHTLKVSQCSLSEYDPTKDGRSGENPHPDSSSFSDSMQKYPVNFYLANGTLGIMASHENEPLAILNVKRGIISAMTTKQSVSDEEHQEELRTDVQGTCPVTYVKVASNTVRMTKDINKCHFPSRVDWHYSPFSLVWNMSFIQSFLIKSEAECLNVFSKDGLKKSACTERHAIRAPYTSDDDKISIRTIVTQSLTLNGVVERKITQKVLTHFQEIQYQYERTPVPTTKSQDLLPKAQEIMNQLVKDTIGGVKPGVGQSFINLVKVLRKAAEFDALEAVASPCEYPNPQLSCTPENKELIEKIATKHFMDAVVQCNSLPCIRQIRRMTLGGDISENYISSVLHAWSRIKITDPEVFTEIREICNKLKIRTCYLSLSAAIHKFWEREQRDAKLQAVKVPSSVEDSIKDIVNLIGVDCSNNETKALMGLKALGNLGNIVRTQVKDIEGLIHRCVHNSLASWAVKVAAVQAARRLDPTAELYSRLMDILKDSSVELEVRVWAYKIIINNWQSSKMLQEINAYLKDHEKKENDDYQLKKFIISNMRAILVDRRNPAVIKFAKLIRKEMLRLHDFNDIEDKAEVRRQGDSFVEEDGAFHKVSFLDDAINQFGIRTIMDTLFDGKVHLPLATFLNISVQVFGKEVNILELLSSSRNQAEIIAELAEHFSLAEDEVDTGELSSAMFKNTWLTDDYKWDKVVPLKFDYNVDEKLLKNLERIRDAFPVPFDTKKKPEFLFGYRIFGDEMGFTTLKFLENALNKYQEALPKLVNNPQQRSSATSFLEAHLFVPTMAGLPLKWTRNAVAVHSINYELKSENIARVAISVDFSGTLDVESKMSISLPLSPLPGNNAGGGIKTFSTGSTSFDTGFALEKPKAKTLRLALLLPKRQVTIMRLSRKNTAYSRLVTVDLEDPKLEQSTQSWCSDEAAKTFGIKICHRSSHAKRQGYDNKQWTLMGRSANWELTADFVDKSVKKYVVDLEDGSKQQSMDISTDGDKLKKIVSLTSSSDRSENSYSSMLTIPAMAIQVSASTRPNDQQGQTCSIDASIMWRKYTFEHTSAQKTMVMLEQDLPNHVIEDKKEENVDVHTSVAVLRSPSNLYTWNRTKTSFLHADIIDHMITFNPSKPGSEENSVLPSSFWQSPNEAWVQLHYHATVDPDEPEHAEAFIKVPAFKIEALFREETVEDNENSYLNLTYISLPDNKLQSFVNITYVAVNEEAEDGTNTCNHRASIILPRVSWSLETMGLLKKRKDSKGNFTLVIRRDTVSPTDPQYEHEIAYWDPKKAGHFKSESKSLIMNVNFATTASGNKFDGYALLAIPGYEPITADIHGKQDNEQKIDTQVQYSISNPNMNLLWKASDKIFYTRFVQDPAMIGTYNHESVWSFIPAQDKNYAVYTIDGTLDDKTIKAKEHFDSSYFVYNSNLNWNYTAPEYSDLTLNIVADSPIWDVLKLQLKQVVFLHGEKMSMKNSLMDVDVEGSWAKGYKKMITVKSKNADLVPNMVVQIELENRGGVIKFTFPDNQVDFYALMNTTADNREFQITFCKHRMCEDIEREPDAFVSQYTYTLDDPTHLAETVIMNPALVKEIHNLIGRRAYKLAEAIVQPIINEDHPLNKILAPILGESSIAEWYGSQMINFIISGKSFGENCIEAIATLSPFIDPISETSTRVFLNTALLVADDDDDDDVHIDTHLSHYIPWLYYDEDDMTRAYERAARNVDGEQLSMRPGPYPGKSHVVVYHMPIIMKHFSSWPRINYAYYDKMHDNDDNDDDDDDDDHDHDDDDDTDSLLDLIFDDDEEEDSFDHPPYQFTFHSHRYNRYALLWGAGHVLTFDGEHVDMPNPSAGGCSYLLLHNRINGKVTVAVEGASLLFLFPEIKFNLLYNGMVMINDSKMATDLPVRSSDGNVTVTRQEDIVEVNTNYHLNVKCSIRHLYCVFATTDFTHNSLVGILGNNDRIPQKQLVQQQRRNQTFLLSPDNSCNEKTCLSVSDNKDMNMEVCFGEMSKGGEYEYRVSQCYKIVDWDKFHERCRADQSCYKNGCSSMHAYHALCGAHDIPIDAPHKCMSCVNGMKIDETNTYTVEPEVEIIFLVDKSQKGDTSELIKRVVALASTIEEAFAKNFKNISFGLLVFRSHGDEEHAEQYSMNGKIFANASDFVRHGLNRIELVEIKSGETPSAKIIVGALDAQSRYYPVRPEPVRISLMITAQDVNKNVDIEDVRRGVQDLESSYFFAISNYPEVEKAIGDKLTIEKIVLTQNGARKSLSESPNGLHARWVFATDGALTHIKLLASDAPAMTRFLGNKILDSTFVKVMEDRSRHDVGKCRKCKCNYPTVYTPQIACSDEYECDAN